MTKIILMFLSIISFAYAGLNGGQVNLIDTFKKMSSKEIASTIAQELAKNAPMQIDKVTTLTRVIALGNRVLVEKMIATGDPMFQGKWKENQEKFHKLMFALDAKIICHDPNMNYIITKKDVIIVQEYTDLNDKPLFSHSIEKADCLQIQ